MFRPCRNGSIGASGVTKNLLQHDFEPPAPNRCWAGNIIGTRTTAGWRYQAVWVGLLIRRLID